jgi:hypothetical protein
MPHMRQIISHKAELSRGATAIQAEVICCAAPAAPWLYGQGYLRVSEAIRRCRRVAGRFSTSTRR